MKKGPSLHRSLQSSRALIGAQHASLLCTCFNGGKKAEIGAWQAANVQFCKDEHFVSPLFLNEHAHAQHLHQKTVSKQQSSLRYRDKVNNKRTQFDAYQFKHESLGGDYIVSYRSSKNTTDCGNEVVRNRTISNTQCSMCTSREITVTSNIPTKSIPSKDRMIVYRGTNGVYMEPFYPALYGRAQSALIRDPNMTVTEAKGVPLMQSDFEEQDNDWTGKACHSARSYDDDDDVIMFQGTRRRFQTRLFSQKKLQNKNSGATSKDVSTVTNARSRSGRPMALVKLYKEDQCSCSNTPPTTPVELVREQKLLQGRLMRSAFTSPSDFVNPLQSLCVQSNSFKQFPVEANHRPCTPPSEVASIRPPVTYQYEQLKQGSVKSIPSSKTNLPDLEVCPTSSLLNTTHQNSPDKDRETSMDKANNSDIVLVRPIVINQRLKSKFQFPFQDQPLSLLHSISSRMTSGPPNLCHAGMKDLLTFPIPKESHDRNLVFKEVPYRHKMVSLRKLTNEVTESDIIVTEESSICALRSRRRRQRQHRKSVIGKSNLRNAERTVRMSVKKPAPQVKVYVKGKAKTLNSLPACSDYAF